jgi:hypothetical protein
MKIKYQWLLAGCLVGPAAHAQQVLLQTDVARDTLPPRTGPNRRYFGHLYASYGLALGGSGAGLPLRYGFGSAETQVGGRLKWRVSNHLAFTTDLRYAYLRYALAYHQLQGELGLRLNTGLRPRGNVVGTYLDLLAYGGPAFAANHTTIDKDTGQGELEATRHAPPYLARWLGGVGLRLGSGSLALVGRYRLSQALRPTETLRPPEPSRFVMGVEIGWF